MKNKGSDKKYSPTRESRLDARKLSKMMHNNEKYRTSNRLSILDEKSTAERNRIYHIRSSNPVIIPSRITEIPGQLAITYDTMDNNETIFEGELMKYKPGLKNMYMSRWCLVTKTHFLYYAEGVPYASYLGRPLAAIPISQIASVKRVCVEVPERNEKFAALKNFQFEIFLH